MNRKRVVIAGLGPPRQGALRLHGDEITCEPVPTRRWGSLVGIQADGLEVFMPTGQAFGFPSWSVERVVMPWMVRWGRYRGVRENDPLG